MTQEEKQTELRWYGAPLRVRYQESDQMGVVYHANYLNWFEIGRTEMIRQAGFNYRSMEERGVLLPVIEINAKYASPARYDDLITIYTAITDFSRLRLNYIYEVRRVTEDEHQRYLGKVWTQADTLPGELLVTGMTRHVWLNTEWKPVRLDQALPELYTALRFAFTGGEGQKS
ncbi:MULTISPECIES: acyl-CoA thioesterase [Paenibacillus]|uniref:Acyl-CoA thioesterase n=1 Tax=Paenibacillus peoriae TaxID=59893 RepID=A0A7H0YD10_9BACL|nr:MULTISPECIES: thioesterase family protein [Paenibacillus]KOS02805.1 thioesterase [Paenibacillus polymyxa]MCP3805736.1 acyl-CoA thioesterase [Paenibacillus sp. Lou8.1]MDY8045368.1 thioesterase family protein [Paenibacillus polymyxa]PNQ81575.1 thioesterase [Paenibacillus sp. F4]QNR68968.1 acyl-CoA thioesterase [Paenibacillus peoriae]